MPSSPPQLVGQSTTVKQLIEVAVNLRVKGVVVPILLLACQVCDTRHARAVPFLGTRAAVHLAMRVSTVMLEDPLWVDVNATLGEVTRRLEESSIRHLPVLRDGVVVGIVSDRDLRSFLPSVETLLGDPAKAVGALDMPVEEAMTTKVVSVQPDRDLKDAVDLMLDQHVGAVVVTDPGTGRLVGIVSYVDVLRAMRDALWG